MEADEAAMRDGLPAEVSQVLSLPQTAEEHSRLGDLLLRLSSDHAHRALHSELGGHAVTSAAYTHSFRCSHTITGPPRS